MSAIRGKYINGTVVLEAPTGWPDGIKVVVRLPTRRDQIEMLEMTREVDTKLDAGSQTIDECTIVDTKKVVDRTSPCSQRS